ncbi:hypothetical protein H6P87_00459 [Rickettsia tillamookensis]|uniref:Permease n=1 Tax=Rickettsia tillamookensis TaxID=2761623 RepID=A0A9E6MHL1_9RICK|nr:Rpn family recombination-promoting nuclease/putative transposase [Rickettsia tillamookensis]QQV74917.1 hypothetical protein H6P87_00459 [Rickettsia tillamookensis]
MPVYSPVKIKALLESGSNKENDSLKSSVADVIVEDEEGHKYIVEIDKSYTNLFLHKACFNSSRLIVDSISKNDDYSTIKKIFHINLLYFPFADMKAPLYHGKTIFREVDKKHPMKFSLGDMRGKIFDLCNVFPEYFVISVPLFNDVIRDELDEWLYVVKHSEVKKDFKSPYMKKIANRLNILKMTPKEQIIYRAYMNKSFKERDYIVSAEEKGIKDGEVRKSIKIAKKMLIKKNSIEEIHEITELSIKEIEQLKAEIENLKK